MENKHLKVTPEDHREIKTLAAKNEMSIMAFVGVLIKAWKKGAK